MTRIPGEVLLDRARRLAQPREEASRKAQETMLAFRVGDERFLSGLSPLREVAPVQRVTPIPGLPSLFAGLCNVRGALVPVLDLRDLLEVRSARQQHAQRILVIETAGNPTGIWVDHLDGLEQIDPTRLRPDHASGGPWFLGRTPELATVIDLPAAVAAARAHATAKQPPEEV